jgi:hypothetical protein
MNLVGKIFVVLIFVMSLVFMSFAVAVYATHRNWRDVVMNTQASPGKPLGLKPQLEELDKKYKNLEQLKLRLESDLANEKASAARVIAALGQEMQAVKDRRDQLERSEAEARQAEREAVAAMNATQATLEKLREEVAQLRVDIDTARNERDESFKKVVQLEDQLAQYQGNYENLRKRNEELTKDVARYQLALSDQKIQLDRNGPPRVDGMISDVRASGYVELTLGFDDGLEKGHELDVYRLGPSIAESKYLGRVRVVETRADVSVAQILPEFKKGIIQKTDRVATRLN